MLLRDVDLMERCGTYHKVLPDQEDSLGSAVRNAGRAAMCVIHRILQLGRVELPTIKTH